MTNKIKGLYARSRVGAVVCGVLLGCGGPASAKTLGQTFVTDRPVTTTTRAEVTQVLAALAERPPQGQLRRAVWWTTVTPLIRPYMMDFEVVRNAPGVADAFSRELHGRINLFGTLVMHQLHLELTRVHPGWRSWREYAALMLEAMLRLPHNRTTLRTLGPALSSLLADEGSRDVALEALRQNPAVLASAEAVVRQILAHVLRAPASKSDLHSSLLALEVLRAQPGTLSVGQLVSLADHGRRLIERDWRSWRFSTKLELKAAFECFGHALTQADPAAGERFLNTVGSATWAGPTPQRAAAVYVGEGLRLYDAEFSGRERAQIADFLAFASQPSPPAGSVARAAWWQRLARRLPESLMSVELTRVPGDLTHVLGGERLVPGALFGQVIIRRLFEEFHESGPLAQGGFAPAVLEAAFDLPVHVITLRELSHFLVGLLQDGETRDVTLQALIRHPRLAQLSLMIREELVHIVSPLAAETYGAETTALALRALARAAGSLSAEHVELIRFASEHLDVRPWPPEALNGVIEAMHALLVARFGSRPVECAGVLATTRW